VIPPRPPLSPAKQALLERRLRGEADTADRRLEDTIRPRRPGDRIPSTFQQQRLWFLDQLVPGTASANIDYAVRLPFRLDVGVLRRCLEELVSRHESLRTTFEESEGGPLQVIEPRLEVPIPIVDLGQLEPAARESEAERLATVEARQPFDLARGPLLRVKVLRLAPERWVLLLTVHHIVADGWSMRRFFDELRTLYECFAAGRPSPLAPLPIQYGDFAVWQRTWLTGEVLDRQLGYWRGQLADLPTLDLPCDRPRPRTQSFAGKSHGFTLPADLTVGLRALGQREGATLFMTLLAGWKALLARYSGQKDLAVGSYIAGRTRPELEGLVGFFVNTLVLRTDLSGDPSFTEVLRRVREVALGAYAHQDVPFEKLVEELQPERDLSRNPLCQVAFQLFSAPSASRAQPRPSGGGPALLEVERGTASFDLCVTLAEDGEQLAGRIEYSTDLYEPASIERLAEHYENLLAAAVADPSRPLSRLEPMSAAERQQVLFGFNETAAVHPEVPLAQLFEAQVERTPEARAFEAEDGELSYRALNARANRLAHHLRALGVGPGVVVGLALPRSIELVVSLLATFKAGGVYLPLDPSYPPERLGFMAAEANAAVVLTRTELLGRFACPASALRLCLDQIAPALAAQPESDVPASACLDDLGYIIFTSGSTGQPKGVAVAQRQVANRLHWMWTRYPFASDEVCCQRTALNFVDALWELLGGLLVGRPTLIVPDRVVVDPPAFVETLAAAGVTRLWVVPSLLQTLLQDDGDLARRLPRLRFWVSSGEPLEPALLLRFARAMPHAVLYNLYGTSEVWDATWYDPREQVGAPRARIPIGRPIANVQTYVLDEALRPLPIGVVGELWVGGTGLARGYLGPPERTAERFVTSPFCAEGRARLYRTGDLARWLPDGTLEHWGRLDHQVKIRGVRVEPGEVEAALGTHPAVRMAAVVPEGSGLDRHLVAYIVAADPGRASGSELRRWLAARLPEVMVPVAVVEVEEMPQTPSGKTDRRALAARRTFRRGLDGAFLAPRTPLEQVLVGIWAELLGVDRVGVHDNFFELGGHSLLATQVVSRVRSALRVEVPVRLLFEAPTVAALAEALCSAEATRPRVLRAAELLLSLLRMPDEQVGAILRDREGEAR
jgi:amino acid adenylation domain-containing protein